MSQLRPIIRLKKSLNFPKETISLPKKTISLLKKTIITVYCDGSTINNGKRYAAGGIGVFFGINDPRNVSEPYLIDIPTNQKTEIYALTRTLQILDLMITNNQHLNYECHIYTDSQYVIKCLTEWIPSWIKNNWKRANGQPIKNLRLLQDLYL